jgi:hypothetical protein
MCAPITVIVGFSCLLTFIFILYKPTSGPGIVQRLGWQSWEVITMTNDDFVAGSQVQNSPAVDDDGTGVDWWNVSAPEQKVDFGSLPLDVWAPLLPHHTGLSEITISRCMFNPSVGGQFCAPSSTTEQDAIMGKWVLVDRNLNLHAGVWHLNIYYRRTRRQDISLITELLLLPENELPSPISPFWHKVGRSIRDGVPRSPPLYLWYRTGKTLSQMNAQERQEDVITELDVLFGEDTPWYGFEKLDPPTTPEEEGRVEAVSLTYRRGVNVAPRAPPLHFSRDGKFKILQVADLHFSVSHGKCRDTVISPCTHSDNMTSTLIEHVLDEEKPSLVVFTGDQLNGQGTSWDPKSVLAKFSKAVAERGIPWAAVFGNHDDEIGAGREEQLKWMQALPYSLVQRGPKDIHGVGNYVLKVMSADASKTHLLTLYFLDSGAYAGGFLDWFGFFTPTEYDYLHKSQISWFLQESGSINQIERPFSPDTGKDFGNIWKRQSDQVTPPTRRLGKPNALMFFHMPLQESYAEADTDSRTNRPLDVGIQGDKPGSAKKNDGFFEDGLLKAFESDHVAGGSTLEVKAVGNGHCHVTENCRRVKGVWLCFGGGGSYSGYSKIGFDRRFRIYDISQYGESISTYKRTEKDEVLDHMILAGPGAAP